MNATGVFSSSRNPEGGKGQGNLRTIRAYLAAVLTTYVLATVFATQSVVARLREMDVPVGLMTRMEMSLHDLAGMVGLFLPIIALGLLLAMGVAGLLGRWKPAWRVFLFPLAGAVALLTIHWALQVTTGITPIAVARSTLGLLSQALAGALGGYCFILIKPRLT